MFKEDRLNYPRNPLIGYLNINSIRNKISDIREVFGKLQLDYFVLSGTKIDESFPSHNSILMIMKYKIGGIGIKTGVGSLNLLGKVLLQKE